jgi:acetolactate synthase small subunit
MTLVTSGNDDIVEQIKKQLNKLIDVVKLQDLSEGEHIEREMMLIKLKAAPPGPRGAQAADRDLPRQDHRRHRHQLRRRTDRRVEEARRLHPGGARGADHRGGPLRAPPASPAATRG